MRERGIRGLVLAVACLLVSVSAFAADQGAAQQTPGMMGGMMGEGMMSGMMGQGMMGPGMMSGEMMSGAKPAAGMMGGCMMPGGMMMPEMMGMMGADMMGMMSGRARGCLDMANRMMMGQVDLAQMHKALDLSDEQTTKLRTALRPLQKEAIQALAALKIGELELADLLSAEKVDFGMVEAKLKEIEAVRTAHRLIHLKAADAVKGLLSKEQLDKLQGLGESKPTAPAAAPTGPHQRPAPQGGSEHESHH